MKLPLTSMEVLLSTIPPLIIAIILYRLIPVYENYVLKSKNIYQFYIRVYSLPILYLFIVIGLSYLTFSNPLSKYTLTSLLSVLMISTAALGTIRRSWQPKFKELDYALEKKEMLRLKDD